MSNDKQKDTMESDLSSSHTKPVAISEELKTCFLDYAMSVITARALPDVRDGLKPVHRRILYAMYDLGMFHNKPYKKSARIVGEVIGKYHPHGDSSIYDAMVRMAQDFSQRYPLIDGHGNFGSLDGDDAAAMRYTEARMAVIAELMTNDLKKNVVDFVDNYDGSEQEPSVLPSYFPNVLANGTMGIAVGMATNIPPHNLGELIDGIIALINNPELQNRDLYQFIKGPDFPTGASILGIESIWRAYDTGHESITMRAKTDIEELPNDKSQIIVNEIPYQVNKANLVEKIADLVRNKVIEGITDLRDESNRAGIRVVIELRKNANVNLILNKLYKYTALQTNLAINMRALDNGEPKLMSLRAMLLTYIKHQIVILQRRINYDLTKDRQQQEIVHALIVALEQLDLVINLIRNSKTPDIALNQLMERLNLNQRQAKAILDMRLQRLTGLEQDKLKEELAALEKRIAEALAILASDQKQRQLIIDNLQMIKEKYNNPRRTEIIAASAEGTIDDESLIKKETVVIQLSQNDYIKNTPLSVFRQQNRGGVGIKGINTNEDDIPKKMIIANSHDDLLFFSNKGLVYRKKSYEIRQFSRQAKGIPIVNLLQLNGDETIKAILPVDDYAENTFFVLTTKKGIIKRIKATELTRIRQGGKIVIKFKPDDQLISVIKTTGNEQLFIGSKNGNICHFLETDVRPMGRTAAGVTGIRLNANDDAIGIAADDKKDYLLVISSNGYGKITKISDYRLTKRASKGVKGLRLTEKTGSLVSIMSVNGDEDLLILNDNGIVIRFSLKQVSVLGRNTQGLKLINLKDPNSYIVSVDLAPSNTDTDTDE